MWGERRGGGEHRHLHRELPLSDRGEGGGPEGSCGGHLSKLVIKIYIATTAIQPIHGQNRNERGRTRKRAR